MVEVGDQVKYLEYEGVVLHKGRALVVGFGSEFHGWHDKRWPGYNCWGIQEKNVELLDYNEIDSAEAEYEI